MINIRNISLFGGLFAIVVIALGAWTRLVDAGLGCPDWPGCYGFVTFPITDSEIALAESRYPTFPYEIDKAIPEVVHRYFAAMLGLIAIFLVFFAIRYKVDRSLRNLSIFLLFFICCQGLFGYLTVSLKLLPIIVTGHLFGGFITLSLFFFIFLKAADFRFLNYIDIKKYRYLALVCLLFYLFRYFLVHGQVLTMPHSHVRIFQLVRVVTIQKWTLNQDSISNKKLGQTIFMDF